MNDRPFPLIHIAGHIPARVEEALRESFLLAEDPIGAQGILSLTTTKVDEKYISRVGPKLRVIANYAVGTNNIDLDAARRQGITVTNTPDVLTRPVAEFAIAITLALLRRVAEGDRFIRARHPWSASLEFMLGESLDEKRLLIIGAGRIGRETARLAEVFGAKAAFVGRRDDLAVALSRADIVSIHCPLTPDTAHLIDHDALARMPSTSVLINAGRGAIVDEHALVEALMNGAIAGAALDVYEFEPSVSEALLSMDNVLLTPHIASATKRTREAMGMLAVEGLRAVLVEGRRPANAVV